MYSIRTVEATGTLCPTHEMYKRKRKLTAADPANYYRTI